MNEDFKGVIKLDIRDSTHDWSPYELKHASQGAPNVLVVLYDDTGLAAWTPFGGRINMPTLQKLADSGRLSPMIGLWAVFALFSFGSLWLFHAAATRAGYSPFAAIIERVDQLFSAVRSVGRVRRRAIS